ncbi:MAG TPA: hypothetical protein VI603_18705 [Saprospiraceae bacterium]|nr:hypothetical protein [Saprospiraceae bacterium]
MRKREGVALEVELALALTPLRMANLPGLALGWRVCNPGRFSAGR